MDPLLKDHGISQKIRNIPNNRGDSSLKQKNTVIINKIHAIKSPAQISLCVSTKMNVEASRIIFGRRNKAMGEKSQRINKNNCTAEPFHRLSASQQMTFHSTNSTKTTTLCNNLQKMYSNSQPIQDKVSFICFLEIVTRLWKPANIFWRSLERLCLH